MPKTCENWLGLVNSSFHYARQTREINIPGTALPTGFQSTCGPLKSTE